MVLRATQRSVPGGANETTAPRRKAWAFGLRPGLLLQVVRKRAVLDADGWLRDAAKNDAPSPAGLACGVSTTASCTPLQAPVGAFSPVALARALPASEYGAMKPLSRKPNRPITFRDRRPPRPCLVVNPGEGAAMPWASWSQPSSENNFPAAARLLAQQILFASRCFTVLRPLRGAARPSLAGRLTTRTRWARPCSTRKEKTSWPTSAPSPQRKTASPARCVL